MTQTDKMLSRKEKGVGYVIFNNPERHNAVSLEMWRACADIMARFATDPEVRVVVLTGAGGKAFVSGADISKFGDERASEDAVKVYNDTVERGYASVHEFPKPTIAMIRGYCIGGGLILGDCVRRHGGENEHDGQRRDGVSAQGLLDAGHSVVAMPPSTLSAAPVI